MKKVLNDVADEAIVSSSGEAIVESSGNVFEDIGVPCSQEDMTKMHFAMAICKIIKKRKLTQAKAAEILETDQAKVSNISRGKVSGFSIERLFLYLVKLGIDVDINLKNGKKDSTGKITVLSKAA